MGKRSKETITLGSGKLYTLAFTGDVPVHETIETPENLLGLISGGASLEYAPEFYDAKDDLGKAQKTVITAEDLLFKSGLITWNGNTLKQLSATARVTEDAQAGTRTLKIGGVENYDGTQYLIRFVHEDKIDGDLRVTLVGSNRAGFTLAFAKDAETIVDAEFKAMPKLDDKGTLVIIEEEIDVAPTNE